MASSLVPTPTSPNLFRPQQKSLRNPSIAHTWYSPLETIGGTVTVGFEEAVMVGFDEAVTVGMDDGMIVGSVDGMFVGLLDGVSVGVKCSMMFCNNLS